MQESLRDKNQNVNYAFVIVKIRGKMQIPFVQGGKKILFVAITDEFEMSTFDFSLREGETFFQGEIMNFSL